jgi:alanine racemase
MTIALSDPVTDFDHAGARLTIDIGAVVENWKRLAAMAGSARTGAAIKADAYGLGAQPIAPALAKAGCRDFFVADPAEGARIRPSLPDARIFVLSGVWEGQERIILDHGLIPVIGSMEQLAAFAPTAAPFALYVDTGMNRLGVTIGEAHALAENGVRPALVVSHLVSGDQPDHAMNAAQCESFQAVAAAFSGVESSLANSAGIFLGSRYHFDLTRPGISLYGGEAVNGQPNPMRTVVSVEARILQVRSVKAGDVVSYGATHRCAQDGRIAIVAAGYADGWHRSLSGSGVPLRQTGLAGASVSIEGERAPIVGRVTMDLTMIDVTDVDEKLARPGTYVELFGHGITLDEAAASAGTIGYELLTSLGRRYQRRLI